MGAVARHCVSDKETEWQLYRQSPFGERELYDSRVECTMIVRDIMRLRKMRVSMRFRTPQLVSHVAVWLLTTEVVGSEAQPGTVFVPGVLPALNSQV